MHAFSLDAALHVLKSDDLATKYGQHYTEEVQKTVMELVGEREVSSKNCCGVIQAAAHWMFGKNIIHVTCLVQILLLI